MRPFLPIQGLLMGCLLILMTLSACSPDPINMDNPFEETALEGQGNLTVEVLDLNGTAIADAEVRVLDNRQTTNTDGQAVFNQTKFILNGAGTSIAVEKPGFFQGSSRIFPLDGASASVQIRLIPQLISGQFQAGSGATVNISGGASIEFTANTIQDQNGQPYQGLVTVAAFWLNPSNNFLLKSIPGSLLGLSAANDLVGLANFGSLAVSLTDPIGNPLNIADGQIANIQFPIPSDLINNAPNRISLWQFNEEDLLWEEEGQATLVGGIYQAEVSHFSFWGCYSSLPLVQLSGKVLTATGAPAIGNLVRVNASNLATTGVSYTDLQGNFSGKVPKDEPLTLSVVDNCLQSIYEQSISPLSADFTVNDINLPDDLGNITIVGQIQDCNGNSLEGTSILTSLSNFQPSFTNSQGQFSITFSDCDLGTDSPLQLRAFDYNSQQQSDLVETTLGSATINLGIITICDQAIDQYIQANIDDTEYYFAIPQYQELSPETIISALAEISQPNSSAKRFIVVRFPSTGLTPNYDGDQSMFSFQFDTLETASCNSLNPFSNNPCEDFSINITANGGSGNYIEGNFSGSAPMIINGEITMSNVSITGSFRKKIP